MSTHANSEFQERSALLYDWAIAGAIASMILLLEVIPRSEMGRISTRTTDTEMEAVEADIAFDEQVEEQQEEVQQQQEEMQQAAEQMIQELQTDVTISLSTDTIGLSSVTTVSQTIEDIGPGDGGTEMGPPRFMPAEVFPSCTFQPAPEYPEMARMAGVEGNVVLWVYVKTDGTVGDVQLYNSSGVESLDQAALSAAPRTRWVPASNNGIPVGVWTTLTYRFTLTT
ncbi:MAG: energy transducer TonB [Candidatus Fermentibacter sp.]|nr:energy transducer TonB [Candidatus Fermentibacter sp.]